MRAILLLALAGLALLASRSEAGGLAVLPASAADIRAGDVTALDELDRAIHAAAVQQVGVAVQSMATTRAHVDAARTLGVQCGPIDLDCLKRLAILSDVDVVLAPAARRSADGWDVDLTLVDVHAPPSARVNRRVQDGASLLSSCSALVAAALQAPPASPPALVVPAGPAAVDPSPAPQLPSAASGAAPPITASASPASSSSSAGGGAWWVIGAGVGAAAVAAGVVMVLAIGGAGAPPPPPTPGQRGTAIVVLP